MDYWYYHWGPFVFRSRITSEECQMLLQEGKKCRKKLNDHRHELAGHLSEEYTLTNGEAVATWLQKYIKSYVEAYKKWRPDTPLVLSQLNLTTLWINYMKKNEFNPPHSHSGDLSFVIYPQVPKEILKENQKYKGRGIGPGGITWHYGEGTQQQYIDSQGYFPKSGDIFIFPSTLKHWVFPFTSKVERISISGNVSLHV